MKNILNITFFLWKIFFISIITLSLNLCDDNIETSIQNENSISSQETPSNQNSDDDLLLYYPQPGNSGIIVINKITSSRVKLFWTKATDSTTPPEQLLYKVYYSLSNTISSVNDIKTLGITASDWSFDRTSIEILNLKNDTIYYFNVLVKDSDNYCSTYTTASVRTSLINYPPFPGNDGILTADNILARNMSLKWDFAVDYETDQNNLEYIIYYSLKNPLDTSLPLLDTFENALYYASPVMSIQWTKNIDSLNISGLSPGSSYFFNVFVRDEDSSITAYKVMEFTTTSDSFPIPGNTGSIIASNIKENSIKIEWTWATDAETDQNKLQYQVYTLQRPTSYDISSYANATTYGTLQMDWQQNMNSFTINSLNISTEYLINVFVKDEDGNISPYQTLTVSTLTPANAFPIPGNNGIIVPSNIKSDSIKIDWTYATDFETAQNILQYQVYTLQTPTTYNLSSYTSATAYGTLQMDWQQNMKNYTISGLTTSTSYIINVFVQDEFGNISSYSPLIVTTD